MKINHDFHIHTALSVCATGHDTALEGFFERAGDTGVRKLGISNHFWDSAVPMDHLVPGAIEFYKVQNFEHLLKVKPEIENVTDFEMYFGCEAEYDPKRGDIAVSEAVAEQFDYIIVPNSHTHLTMLGEDYGDMQKQKTFLIKAFEDIVTSKMSKYVTAIAHPFEVVGYTPDKMKILFDMITDDEFKRLFDLAAERGIAYEINHDLMMWKEISEIVKLPTIRLYRLAKECGCKFIFGSDAHGYEGYRDYAPHCEYMAGLVGITEDDIVEIAR